MILQGLRRRGRPERRKTPVSLALLRAVFARQDVSSPADLSLWGALCLAFFFLLRKSEIVATGTTFKWSVLRRDDISLLDAQGQPTRDAKSAASVAVRLHGSKTNQLGPEVRVLNRSSNPVNFPVLGALCTIRAQGNLPGHLPAASFQSTPGKPDATSCSALINALRTAATDIGGNPSALSLHSMRAGGATLLHRAGIDATTIQLHGRWASDAYKRYTRLCEDSVKSIARHMVSSSARGVSLG